MQKQIYLSVFLGLLFNTLFFAQTEINIDEQDVTIDGQTEVTIERTIIDEDGNETKIVIIKTGDDAHDLVHNASIEEHVARSFDCNDGNKRRHVTILGDSASPRARFVRGMSSSRDFHGTKPKVRMGVELESAEKGIKITHVDGNSAAAEAGLQADDIITHLDNQPVENHGELTELLMDKEVGDKLAVTYQRDGEEATSILTLKQNNAHPDFAENSNCRYLEKPCLGVRYNSWNEGIRLSKIYEASGAANAGLQAGDKLTKVNGQTHRFGTSFDKMIKSQRPGNILSIEYEREGELFETEAEVGIWDECGVCNLASENPEIEELEFVRQELELSSFDMYPVPAIDRLTVSFIAEQAPIEVTLFDVNGKVIAVDKLNDFSGSFTKTYELQNVAKGLAVISIEQNGRTTTRQALIQ